MPISVSTVVDDVVKRNIFAEHISAVNRCRQQETAAATTSFFNNRPRQIGSDSDRLYYTIVVYGIIT